MSDNAKAHPISLTIPHELWLQAKPLIGLDKQYKDWTHFVVNLIKKEFVSA